MKEAVASWEPQARAVMRFMAMYMILQHGLREVFGFMPARARGPGSFMPLDPLGQVGGVFLLVFGTLLLVGLFSRVASLVLALQCVFAYFYAAAPRGAWPIRNGGIDTLTYALIFLYLAGAGSGAWSLDALFRGRKGQHGLIHRHHDGKSRPRASHVCSKNPRVDKKSSGVR